MATHAKYLPTVGWLLDKIIGERSPAPSAPRRLAGLAGTFRPVIQPVAQAVISLKPAHVYRAPRSADEVFALRQQGTALSLDVTPGLCNPIGGLHGGAAVM